MKNVKTLPKLSINSPISFLTHQPEECTVTFKIDVYNEDGTIDIVRGDKVWDYVEMTSTKSFIIKPPKGEKAATHAQIAYSYNYHGITHQEVCDQFLHQYLTAKSPFQLPSTHEGNKLTFGTQLKETIQQIEEARNQHLAEEMLFPVKRLLALMEDPEFQETINSLAAGKIVGDFKAVVDKYNIRNEKDE